MGKYAGTIYTLADAAKRRDPTGRAAAIVEILSQTNEIISDAAAVECNAGEVHRTPIRDSIPLPGVRMLNQGVDAGKSGVREVVDGTMQRALQCPIDLDMEMRYEAGASRNEFLYGEFVATLEGFNQMFVRDIFYGNMGTDPGGIDGLATRYNTIDPTKFIASHVIDAGGTGANLTSVWIIQWGPNACNIIYPKGMPAGFTFKKGEITDLVDDDGKVFEGRRLWAKWNYGLCVRDWRRVVRIANVDTGAYETLIANGAATPAEYALQRRIFQAYQLLPDRNGANTAIYANNKVISMLNILAGERGAAYNYTVGEQRLPQMYAPLGIPIRRVDGLIAEDQVVA